ncbi:MAG: 3-isopropylmalate dehydrogenase, partial [Chloroflexi bacterium]|nr:3-isopropylmalate dehydrogenase [Chloroflexota bacterium]
MSRTFRIHPAIGIARLGDSPDEYFVGAEAPGVLPSLGNGKRRDAQQRIKRQGARFRIYEYEPDASGALKAAREITAAEAQIEWQVHLANRKAA